MGMWSFFEYRILQLQIFEQKADGEVGVHMSEVWQQRDALVLLPDTRLCCTVCRYGLFPLHANVGITFKGQLRCIHSPLTDAEDQTLSVLFLPLRNSRQKLFEKPTYFIPIFLLFPFN